MDRGHGSKSGSGVTDAGGPGHRRPYPRQRHNAHSDARARDGGVRGTWGLRWGCACLHSEEERAKEGHHPEHKVRLFDRPQVTRLGHVDQVGHRGDDDGCQAEERQKVEEAREGEQGEQHHDGGDEAGQLRLGANGVVDGRAGEGAGDWVRGEDRAEQVGDAQREELLRAGTAFGGARMRREGRSGCGRYRRVPDVTCVQRSGLGRVRWRGGQHSWMREAVAQASGIPPRRQKATGMHTRRRRRREPSPAAPARAVHSGAASACVLTGAGVAVTCPGRTSYLCFAASDFAIAIDSM